MSGRGSPNALTGFIDPVSETEWSNQTTPEPVERMLEAIFSGLAIETTEIDRSHAGDDLVVLVHNREVVASSPLGILRDTLLVVTSGLYKTGTRKIQDIDPPDTIKELPGTVFTLRGYPESSIEKLVLALVSRYIEYQAWSLGTGTLRSSFSGSHDSVMSREPDECTIGRGITWPRREPLWRSGLGLPRVEPPSALLEQPASPIAGIEAAVSMNARRVEFSGRSGRVIASRHPEKRPPDDYFRYFVMYSPRLGRNPAGSLTQFRLDPATVQISKSTDIDCPSRQLRSGPNGGIASQQRILHRQP